jgi:tellurite resistance-related uncharacterized protein
VEPIITQIVPVWFKAGNPEVFVTTQPTDDKGWVKGNVLASTYEDGIVRYNILDDNGVAQQDSDLKKTTLNNDIRTQYITQQRAAQQNPPVSPEQRAAEATTAGAQARAATALDAERAQNAANGDGYVTNADLAKQQQEQKDAAVRLQQVNAQIAAIQAQAQSTADTNAIRREENARNASQFGVTSAQTDRQISQGDERIGLDREKIGIDREDLGIKREQVGLQGRQVDIAESQNAFEQGPKFDLEKTKQAFAEKQAQLSNLLAARRIDQETAIAEMNNWWRRTVEGPFKMDEAARMRAAEERQLQQLEDSSAQFAATHSLNRARLGVDAGHYAAEEAISTFPYRGGPNLGANMSAAINSLAKGSSAGVNFSPDDFNFNFDLDKTRERATASALKNVSPYARNIVMQNEGRTSTPLPTVDWNSMPSMGSQPTAVTDFIQQYYPGMIAPDQPEQPQE